MRPGSRARQHGVTLIELVLATAISAILLASISSLVKLGLDTQTAGRGNNELAYQGRFALERIADKARATAPKELTTPVAGTTGDWFAPAGCTAAACVMFCRNSNSQVIETVTTDTSCTGSAVIANRVSVLAATLPTTGALDGSVAVISLTLTNSINQASTLTASIRLGGGTL